MATAQGRSITYGNLKVIDANPSKYPVAAKLANSYTCPLGPATGVGYVLMLQSDVVLINKSTTPKSLVFQTVGVGKETVEIKNLFLEKATRVDGGSEPDDPNALQLVKLVDIRYQLNRWSATIPKSNYNLRNWSGGDPDRFYIRETVSDFQTPLTWNQVIKQLWDACNLLGPYINVSAFDALPPPEDLYLDGVNAWRAMNELLVKIGYTTLYNPLAATFSVIRLRGENTVNLRNNTPHILYDANAINGGACVAPQTIRVNFPVKYEDHGYERDSQPTNNWVSTVSGFAVILPTNVAGAVAGTQLQLWDSTPAVKLQGTDHAATTLQNQGDITSIAFTRVDSWLRNRAAVNRDHLIYSGLYLIFPATNIRRVVWRDWGEELNGMVTEVMDYPGLDSGMEVSHGDFSLESYDGGEKANELYQPPDFGRHTWSDYPSLSQLVRITTGTAGEVEGRITAAEGTNIFGGKVIKFNPATKAIEVIEDCWVYVEGGPSSPAPIEVAVNDVTLSRLSGMYVGSGENRLPLYVASIPENSDKSIRWGFVTETVYAWNTPEPPSEAVVCTEVAVSPTVSCDGGGGLEIIQVKLPEILDTLPHLTVGDVIAYSGISSNGESDFVCVSAYSVTEAPSVIAKLNADLDAWSDTPGCQVVTAEIVTCGGSTGTVGQSIKIIFPNVPGKIPAISMNDQVGATPTDLISDPPIYIITSDYSKLDDPSVVASLNSDLSAWPDTPGCQTATCTVVICNGSGGTVGETIDVIIPNVPGKVPAVFKDDFIAASPTDTSVTIGKYVISSDYSKTEVFGTRPVELVTDMSAKQAEIKFLDVPSDPEDIGHDFNNVWPHAIIGDTGMVTYNYELGQWMFVDLPCDDGLGGGS